ncbi:MAG: YjbQ family protein, partial [Chloroflexi bacterium]|nr:YjbQ family protein [Chloroflexota bacterium]
MQTKTKVQQPLQALDGKAFKVRTYSLSVTSAKAPEFVDITEQVDKFVRDSGVESGLVVVYSRHTTAAIRINENEP